MITLPARDFLGSLFLNSIALERLAGGTGAIAAQRRLDFFRSLHAIIVRLQTKATARLPQAHAVSAQARRQMQAQQQATRRQQRGQQQQQQPPPQQQRQQ